jgi:hypothetical protein
MGNNIIYEGKAKFAMAMIIPAIVNIILDILYKYEWDVMRSLATSIFLFYVLPFVLWFFVYKKA